MSVFATPLVPTSSPPPPSSPVICVRDAVYEYETVGTLHSQTDADTQDTVEHQTVRQRQKIAHITESASDQRIHYNMDAYCSILD